MDEIREAVGWAASIAEWTEWTNAATLLTGAVVVVIAAGLSLRLRIWPWIRRAQHRWPVVVNIVRSELKRARAGDRVSPWELSVTLRLSPGFGSYSDRKQPVIPLATWELDSMAATCITDGGEVSASEDLEGGHRNSLTVDREFDRTFRFQLSYPELMTHGKSYRFRVDVPTYYPPWADRRCRSRWSEVVAQESAATPGRPIRLHDPRFT